jgi:hypothetical protein
MIDIEKKIRAHLDKEARTNLRIENLDITNLIKLKKGDYSAAEEYPIVDKGVILVEVEYYVNGEGVNRCFAIEEGAGRFLDMNNGYDVTNLIMKTNKRISDIESEIRRLDFEKADDANIKCTKVLIENKDGKESVTKVRNISAMNEWERGNK